jgi:putative DNA primase/helicase
VSSIARPPAQGNAHSVPSKPPSAHISDQDAATIPAALKEIHQWVVWRWTLRDGKWSKPPINPLTGRPVNAVGKTVWMTFDQARESAAAVELAADGIGFALGPNGINGLVGVDLDKCVDERGNIEPTARRWVEALGSYTECTPSGRGLRIWIRATISGTRRRKGNVEVYDRDRYFTITGDHVEGTPRTIEHRQEAFEAFYSEALADGSNGRGNLPDRDQNSHAQPAPLDLSDDELIRKARQRDPDFGPLFDGNTGGRNPSSADMALMNKLAFWFGRDPTRMERAFSGSKLAERGKWNRRNSNGEYDYRKRTITAAIAKCENVYTPRIRSASKPSTNGKGQAPPIAPKTAKGGDDDLPAVNEGPDDPHRLARIYRHSGKDGAAIVVYHQAEFHLWDGAAYRTIPAHVVRAGLSEVAKREFDRINPIEVKAWEERRRTNLWTGRPCAKPEARKVSRPLIGNMELALSGTSLIYDRVLPPVWLIDNPPFPAVNVLPMRNALVHLPSFVEGKATAIHPPTPAFYCPYALDYDFDPKAKAPENWMNFLLSVWPNEGESILALQEWMGYLLTLDTRQQKIAFLIGPPRSGRGTIARIIKQMIGPENFAGPTLSGLASPFGAQCLIGKTAAIIADARISNRSDWAVVLERLLAISGEDHIEVDRKNLPTWSGTLPTRIMLISNELPRLPDQSGALIARMLAWRFVESFADREDKELDAKLQADLPGILLWSIDGWKRLWERGSFLQPPSGQELINEMRDLSGPVGAWFRERCDAEPEASVPVDVAFADWCAWCDSKGKEKHGDEQNFGRYLRAVLPRLETKQQRVKDGEKSRVRVFQGFRLKPTDKEPY